jgi:serine/threonine-protein kinase
MLTGKLPFEGDSPVAVAIKHINSTPVPPRQLNPNIPEGLEQITLKAMASNPNDRYDSARAMLMDLDSFRKNPAIVFPYAIPTMPVEDAEEDDEDEEEESDSDSTRRVPGGIPIYGTPSRNRPGQSAHSSGKAYTEAEDEDDDDEDEEDEDSRKSRGSRGDDSDKKGKAGVVAVVAIVLIAFFAMVGIFVHSMISGGTPETETEHTVPNVVTMLYEEAVLRYGDEFDFAIIGYKEDDTAKEGTILEQTPEADEVLTGDKPSVNVVVCKGSDSKVLGYMPNLENERENVAIQALLSMGVEESNIIKGTSVYSDTVDENCVVSTSPSYGTSLDKDTVITYYLSMGKDPNAPVTIPNLVNQTKADAISQLKELGITMVETQEEYNDSVEEGAVIRTSPGSGSSVTVNDTVTLVISKGQDPATIPVTVPKFVGQNETVVMAQLKEINLTGTFNRVADSSEAGTVLTQSVSQGTQVSQGTNITFTVSSGPEESPSPAVSESPSPSPSPSPSTSESPSPAVNDKTVTVNLPNQEGEVRVQVDVDGVTMYAATVDCSKGSLPVTLSGSGSQEVDVYIDGTLTQTMTVNFG